MSGAYAKKGEQTYHCGPPPASRRVTVDDAVLSAPLCHLPIVTIHALHINTADLLVAPRPNKRRGWVNKGREARCFGQLMR